jgi:cytochrome c biogenesis protein CcdA
VGTISRLFTNWLEANAMYAALVIGIALMVMGVRMLGGWRPRLWVPSLTGGMGEQGQGQQGSRPRSVASMFGFGVVYAIASIGCTIGLLTTAILGSFSRHGVLSGIVSVALYGLGMGVFVTALTVSLAFAKGALVRSGRSVMKAISSVSSALVVLTGVYLTWYWYVAITRRTNQGNMVEIVGRWQSMLVRAMSDVGALALSATLTVVIIGILAVSVRHD